MRCTNIISTKELVKENINCPKLVFKRLSINSL